MVARSFHLKKTSNLYFKELKTQDQLSTSLQDPLISVFINY